MNLPSKQIFENFKSWSKESNLLSVYVNYTNVYRHIMVPTFNFQVPTSKENITTKYKIESHRFYAC